MKIGNIDFKIGKQTYVMGILNVTPDSFSDGGKYNTLDRALQHAENMVKDGADLIDVGGESTRPGYQFVPVQEEIERVSTVIEQLKKNFDVPISVDTYKSQVAKAAIIAGADLVNDIWGLRYDEEMANVIADAKVACCLMHNRKEPQYDNFLTDVTKDLEETIAIAKKANIDENKIMLDPGVGFGKTYEMNLKIIQQLNVIQKMGYPVLLGASRKSVIGRTLDVPETQREEGTIVTTVWAVQNGCSFVRVHDVKANKRAIQMAQAIRDVEIFTEK